MNNVLSIFRKLIVLTAVIFLFLSAGITFAEETIKLGIFPRKGALETKISYEPLRKYLSEKTGKKVELILSKDFTAFWESVKNREFDLVHYNQYHYIKSHKELGYNIIVKNEEAGSAKARSAIVVRKDSGIDSIAGLKGKKIVFGGGKQAMQAYIGVVYLLKKNGFKSGDYIESVAVNPPSAAMAVYSKTVDAGGIGDVIMNLPSLKQKIDVSQLKFVAEGEPLPMLCWAVKKEMIRSWRRRSPRQWPA